MSSPPRDDPPSVLLTGATSYLGLALAGHLAGLGSRVTAVVRATSPIERFERLDAPPATMIHDGTTASLVDILDEVVPDVVVHLATLYRRDHTPEDVAGLVTSNVLFGTQLLEAMRIAGCRRLVAAASYFQHYDSDGYRPLNLYAATKQAFEDILAFYVDACGFSAFTLVLYDVYGPGDWRPKLMDAIRTAQTTGVPLPLPDRDIEMDLVFVDDVVDAFSKAVSTVATVDDATSVRYGVSSGRRSSLSELVSAFEEVAGKPVPHEWGRFVTPDRAVTTPWTGPSLPGWEPRWSLRDGIARFLAAT